METWFLEEGDRSVSCAKGYAELEQGEGTGDWMVGEGQRAVTSSSCCGGGSKPGQLGPRRMEVQRQGQQPSLQLYLNGPRNGGV